MGYVVPDDGVDLFESSLSLHDVVHLVEVFDEGLVVELLLEAGVEVEFEGEVALDILGHFGAWVGDGYLRGRRTLRTGRSCCWGSCSGGLHHAD